MASLVRYHSPNLQSITGAEQAEPSSQPSSLTPHPSQQLVVRPYEKNVLVHWFWSFSAIISWPFRQWLLRWFTGNDAKGELYQVLNDLDSTLSTLQDARDESRDISFLKEFSPDSKEWADLVGTMDAVHVRLVNFRQSLERSVISQLPDELTRALLSLCSHLNRTVVARRLLGQNRITIFSRRGHVRLLKDLETCVRETMLSLDALDTLITTDPKIICEIPIPANPQETTLVDIAPKAMPQRYRFVDCSLFTQNNILHIEESLDFPEAGYTVISYVWRGKSALPDAESGKLAVKGAEHADPISLEVLKHACVASLKRGIPYIWMDRLCIIQSSREDKNWQISRMFQVYQSSHLCIVLAGGMQRLVRLDEETTWIHRGWTLQEVLAPATASVLVLFAWALGPGEGQASVGIGGIGLVEEVIPQQSATASLSLVLDACALGYLSFSGNLVGAGRSVRVKSSIFSDLENHSFNDPPFWQPQRKVLAPNVTALAYILNGDQAADSEAKSYAIWKSALMRTSSRPVDMVFSIMGLFGVILDPGAFEKNDRLGATIALATEILKKGGSATWLGASFQMDPCRQLSTFSTFPQTSVSGKALVLTKEGLRQVSQLMDSEYPYGDALLYMPRGSMDADGYFHFSRKAIRVVFALEEQRHRLTASRKPYDDPSNPTHVRAMDGSVWKVEDDAEDELHSPPSEARVYMVLLGWFNEYYPGGTSAHDGDNIRAMLIEEHVTERYHVRSFVCLARQSKAWVLGWKEYSFSVGGSTGRHQDAGDEQTDSHADQLRELVTVEERLPFPTSRRSDVTLRDDVTRKSRWAVDQRVLERHYAVLQDK